MTLFDYRNKKFNGKYKELAQHIWDKKGKKDYDRTELLLVSRLVGQINVDELACEINKLDWKYLRIWLSIFNSNAKTWTLFEMSPYPDENPVGQITVGLTDLPY